ncbi:lytic murein transglycosylase [Zestomonas carbonaria]|uniref:Tn3 family transposase TnXax1 n=1 Tax=Zestomonas carbonaria TaxID=2762745 RepID=A0A7U7EMA5_9GAMM|nr:lytic murein transglycosylase [Pseudomonas carbonaria]CAD5107624.1 Tn3 family transposase TnXax1 [Pseudomonas carbonaria]
MPKHPLRTLACATLTLHLGLLSACASDTAEAPTPAPSTPPAPTKQATVTPASQSIVQQPSSLSFADWRDQLRREALAAGIDAKLFDRAFAGVTPDPKVIAADRSQPEFTRPVWEYLDSAVSPARLERGRRLLGEHRATLDSIQQRYGVSKEVLVAVWGMESAFGSHIGDYNVIRSLATLAYEGRRQAFWREQLLAALQILQHGDIAPERLVGSWAGAMGQTQFIPTTYNQHAVDFDGDGRRDLWNSSADALASAAHYLGNSGWQPGQPWGFEVRLPEGFDYGLADPDERRSLAQWAALGVKPVKANANAPADASAALLLPAGHRGPAFLVLNNFRSILRYNNSTSYALAIGLLADGLATGSSQLQGSWPRSDRQLGRSERVELQELLAQRGFSPGAADGIIGANTRKAIRGFQQQLGWPADGYPNAALLEALRR